MSFLNRRPKEVMPQAISDLSLDARKLPKHVQATVSDAQLTNSFRDLTYLQDWQHPVSRQWVGKNSVGYSYIDQPTPDRCKDLLTRLQGRKIVELGFGATYSIFHKELWEQEPTLHIAVDESLQAPSTATTRQLALGRLFSLPSPDGHQTERHLLEADMLAATSVLPDQSVSFVINGVDNRILRPDYEQALLPEIARATEIGGYVVGCTYSSGVLAEIADHGDFETTQERWGSTVYYAHQRLG